MTAEIVAILDTLADVGIEIKLGQIPDDQRHLLAGLTKSQLQGMKQHKVDLLRVLLAREMLAEAKSIELLWNGYPGQRTPELGRRYRDLLFSARAMLPAGIPWERVTYQAIDGPVPWTRQLAFDGAGSILPDAHYDTESMTNLLDMFKEE